MVSHSKWANGQALKCALHQAGQPSTPALALTLHDHTLGSSQADLQVSWVWPTPTSRTRHPLRAAPSRIFAWLPPYLVFLSTTDTSLGTCSATSEVAPSPTPIKKKNHFHFGVTLDFQKSWKIPLLIYFGPSPSASPAPPREQRSCSFCFLLHHQHLEHSAWHTPDANVQEGPCTCTAHRRTLSGETHHLKPHSVSRFRRPVCILSLFKTETKYSVGSKESFGTL